MIKYLNEYIGEYESQLNTQLMNKEADRPLVDYVVDAWKSLEIVKNIKFIRYEYTEEESSIDINHYIFKRDKRKRKKDRVDYKFINDDRVGKLSVWIQVTLDEKDTKTNEIHTHQKLFRKDMLIPLQDEDGNLFIKGKNYYMIYQLVEKSTYTSSQSITIKSLMPVAIKRETTEKDGLEEVIRIECDSPTEVSKYDINEKKYILPVYNVFVFKKEIPIILFYATKGLDHTLTFLGVDDCINFVQSIDFKDRKDDCIYFPISSKCYLEVYKPMFDKYSYVQSVVGGILSIVSNRFTIDQVSDGDMWIRKLGNGNNYDKGMDMLTFFQRLLDETTKKVLKVNEYHLTDIYTLLRWAMMNFNELRMKDNMDLKNKRIRCNEYIASLLTIEFSRRLNRIISLGAKVTMENFKDIFKFPGDILLQKMHSSGILRFDDNINDMNFFTKFKVTSKGPHALGGRNSNNINMVNRGLHPSYLGNFDLLVCGNSDPGTSFVMSPFCKIDGLYFDPDSEPDEFLYNYKKDMEEYLVKSGYIVIPIQSETKEEYYSILNKSNKISKEEIKIEAVPKNTVDIIIDETELNGGDDDTNDDNETVKELELSE